MRAHRCLPTSQGREAGLGEVMRALAHCPTGEEGRSYTQVRPIMTLPRGHSEGRQEKTQKLQEARLEWLP